MLVKSKTPWGVSHSFGRGYWRLPSVAKTHAVEQEAAIRGDLINWYGTSQTDQINGLINAHAHAQLMHRWEVNYRTTIGSQIALLKRLNVTLAGLSRSEVVELFSSWKNVRPLMPNVTFPQWLGFLTDNNLVTRSGDRCVITTAGQEFLAWMLRVRAPDDRPA